MILEAASALWAKNQAFVLFRFPNEKEIRLGIDPALCPVPASPTFVMAPFCAASAATTVSWTLMPESSVDTAFLKWIESLPHHRVSPYCDLPPATTRAQYDTAIAAYLQEIRSGLLDKAILSRVIRADKPEGFNPVACFGTLHHDYPDAFVHLSVHPQSGVWLGATPELLLKKEEEKIFIMALAGSQARQPSGNYHWRDKELEEHLMVGRHIEAVFAARDCKPMEKSQPHTVAAGRVAHLCTDYVFPAPHSAELPALIADLHPTPAVGGLPVELGVACILRQEGYDRTYYSGYLGVQAAEHVALYVNLRCMQVGTDQIAVYAGGGITAASNPEEEWQETVLKSKTMLEKIRAAKKA